MTAKTEAKRTPATLEEMVGALRAAWGEALPNATPSGEAIALFAAQWAHETRLGHDMYNWNIGNAKAGPDAPHMFLRTWERLSPVAAAAAVAASTPTARCEFRAGGAVDHDGLVEINVFPDHPSGRFRAYGSLAEGCVAYLRMFAGRYRDCVPFALSADPAAFVHALHARGYFTGPEAAYLGGVERYYAQALPEATRTA